MENPLWQQISQALLQSRQPPPPMPTGPVGAGAQPQHLLTPEEMLALAVSGDAGGFNSPEMVGRNIGTYPSGSPMGYHEPNLSIDPQRVQQIFGAPQQSGLNIETLLRLLGQR